MLRRAHIALLIGAALTLGAGPAPAEAPDPITERPCFGAASRDRAKPCSDPALRLRIHPAPDDAALEPNAPCDPTGRTRLLYPCRFGVQAVAGGPAPETIALVGDSHASHWRAAVEVVAALKGRAAVSIARSRCPLIDATVVLPRADSLGCRGWNRELRTYLARHPEITTLFVSVRAGADFVRVRGKSNSRRRWPGTSRCGGRCPRRSSRSS